MKVKEYRKQFVEKLTPIYGEMESDSFFNLILLDYHQLNRVDLALDPDLRFTVSDLHNWNTALYSLLREVPIQYILGKTQFYGLPFEVNSNVLIPRPETEELVEWILENNPPKDNQKLKILDIGTGSGCIAIALAKNLPSAQVFAIDVSPEAITVAKRNADLNHVAVHFMQQDILTTRALTETFDIIVSNPPYVRNLEKHEIKSNVIDNEPHLALFVDDHDALIFYRKIVALALKILKKDGELYFEINQYLAKETVALLEINGLSHIELREDIYGNARMTLGKVQR